MELARELRNNLLPYPSAHSPYGNSTLSPGSQGLPPDSSVMALFNASATNTRQLLPLASYPYSGAWGSHPPGLTFQNKLSSLCIIGARQWPTYLSSSPFFQKAFFFLSSALPLLLLVNPCSWSPFSSSPQDGESGEPRNWGRRFPVQSQ